jgi:nitronate monooxygenase
MPLCRVNTLERAFRAVDVGADFVVAQRTGTGEHGFGVRSTMPFVPALASRASHVLVLVAGGIAVGGGGLAASRMIGADGVVMVARICTTQEALIPDAAKLKVLVASADETIRTSVYDITRQRAYKPGHAE